MMESYVGWIICGAMAVTLVAVLFFDSRSRHTGKSTDVGAKDEDDQSQ